MREIFESGSVRAIEVPHMVDMSQWEDLQGVFNHVRRPGPSIASRQVGTPLRNDSVVRWLFFYGLHTGEYCIKFEV